MHPRNPHKGQYKFKELCQLVPELKLGLKKNPKGQDTIDFADPNSVMLLNQALLAKFYDIKYWMLPDGYLCPPIPGRADYIHYLADLLAGDSKSIPKGKNTQILDVGTGANCIYPMIGHTQYGWKFVATDIDKTAVEAAKSIVQANPNLTKSINVVQQKDVKSIFQGVLRPQDSYAATMCNPPFYSSAKEAQQQNQAKQRNLTGQQKVSKQRNFAGQSNELWCEGGEVSFLKRMIRESVDYKSQVGWFTSLVSKRDHIPVLKRALKRAEAAEVQVIKMEQGNKISRILAWRFD